MCLKLSFVSSIILVVTWPLIEYIDTLFQFILIFALHLKFDLFRIYGTDLVIFIQIAFSYFTITCYILLKFPFFCNACLS